MEDFINEVTNDERQEWFNHRATSNTVARLTKEVDKALDQLTEVEDLMSEKTGKEIFGDIGEDATCGIVDVEDIPLMVDDSDMSLALEEYADAFEDIDAIMPGVNGMIAGTSTSQIAITNANEDEALMLLREGLSQSIHSMKQGMETIKEFCENFEEESEEDDESFD